MSRSITNPIVLPRFSVFGGRPIVSGAADAGLEVIAQAVQTAYEQCMGDAIDDAGIDGGSIGDELYYRIKNMRRDGKANLRVGVRCTTGVGAATGSVAIDGGTPEALAWAALGDYVEDTADIAYNDAGIYSDVEINVSGADAVVGVRASDLCSRAEVPASPLPNGLVGLEAGRYLPGMPVSVARTRSLCAMGRSLFNRMAGQILASCNSSAGFSGTHRIEVPAPLVAVRGGLVHTASLWCMGTGQLVVTTSQGSYTCSPSTSLGTWPASATVIYDLLPEEGATVPPSVAPWELVFSGDIWAVSCYWDDLPEEAYP